MRTPSFQPGELENLTQAMCRLAGAVAGGDARGEDAAQEAWVRALRRGRAGGESLARDERAWLVGVARNVAREQRRSEKHLRERHGRLSPGASPEGADVAVARLDAMAQLIDAVRALEAPYRSAITLQYLMGMASQDAAELLEVPAATFRTRVRRGLARLRERLGREEGSNTSSSGRRALVLGPLVGGMRATGEGSSALGIGAGGIAMTKSAKLWVICALLLALVGGAVLVMQTGDGAGTPVADGVINEEVQPVRAGAPAETAPTLRAASLKASDDTGVRSSQGKPSSKKNTIAGVLRLPDGTPVGGVHMALGKQRIVSDADGSFELVGLRRGAYSEVWIYGNRNVVGLGPVRLRAGLDAHELVLQPAVTVSGTLLVPDAIPPEMWEVVAIYDRPHEDKRERVEALVDAQSRFMLEGLPAGIPLDLEVRLDALKYRKHVGRDELSPDELVYRHMRLEGTIVAPLSRVTLDVRSLAEARVKLTTEPSPDGEVVMWLAADERPTPPWHHLYRAQRTKASVYRGPVPFPGVYRIAHSPTRPRAWLPLEVLWEIGQEHEIAVGRVVELARPATCLDETVFAESLVSAGFSAGVRRQRDAPSLERGIAVPPWARTWLDPADRWWLYAFHADGRYVLSRANAEGRFDLKPAAGTRLRVEVLDLDGKPMPGPAVVWVFNKRLARIVSLEEGRDPVVGGIPPGRYVVRVKMGASSTWVEARDVQLPRKEALTLRFPGR